jgi:hypothetical protein
MLTFNEEIHQYYWDGKPIPNVTSIIKDLTSYDMIQPGTLELARQKGVFVHKMVELWALGQLGERGDQPEWIRPCYDEFLKFANDVGLKVLAPEKKIYHPIYKYAGTLDLRCTMRHKKGVGILDVKRSFMAGDVIGLQLAGYEGAENADKSQERIEWRAAIRIHENHKYRLESYEDSNDWAVFIACLVRYKWIKAREKQQPTKATT